MKFKFVDLLTCALLLSSCSVQSSDYSGPLVGFCDEFPYDKKISTGAYVILPIRGEITSSINVIHIEVKSTLTIPGYAVLVCTGQQDRSQNQKVIDVDLSCHDGTLGTAFINLGPTKNGLGNGLFSLSNGTYGTFQFGYNLLLSYPA